MPRRPPHVCRDIAAAVGTPLVAACADASASRAIMSSDTLSRNNLMTCPSLSSKSSALAPLAMNLSPEATSPAKSVTENQSSKGICSCPCVTVFIANDVIFANIGAGLHLDKHHRDTPWIFDPVLGPDGDVN